MQKIDIGKKESPRPSSKEIKFSKTLEGKIYKQMTRAIKGDHIIEAYVFSWALIEQVLLPKLIKFIAKQLKLKLPKSSWDLNQMPMNHFYLAISHDKILFNKLEIGRKERNKIIHKFVDSFDDKNMQTKVALAIKSNSDLSAMIFERLTGRALIPSLTIYARGWNDAVRKQNEKIDEYLRSCEKSSAQK